MKKILKYLFIFIILVTLTIIFVKFFDLDVIKKVLKFFNTGIGTALIGFIGVIVGSIISYLFNKSYQNKLLKNSILEKCLDELLNISVSTLKCSSNIYPKKNYISNNIYYFKEKTEHSVNDKMHLEMAVKEYDNAYRTFEEELANIIIHFETHQIILNEFKEYHQKFMLLNIELVTITNNIKTLYNDKIYISLHKINLTPKYIKLIEEMEKKSYSIIEEIQFHLQNLTSDIQNMSYSKIFKGINIEKDKDNKYTQIKLVKNKNKMINFSKFE